MPLLLLPSTPIQLKRLHNALCYITDQIIISQVQSISYPAQEKCQNTACARLRRKSYLAAEKQLYCLHPSREQAASVHSLRWTACWRSREDPAGKGSGTCGQVHKTVAGQSRTPAPGNSEGSGALWTTETTDSVIKYVVIMSHNCC